MRDFAKVSPSVWRSKKFRSLSMQAQISFFGFMCGRSLDDACNYNSNEAIRELEQAGILKVVDGQSFYWIDKLGCIPAPRGKMTGRARKWISNAIRNFIFDRDGHSCVYCGAKTQLQLDHIEPHSRGGSDDPRNLVTACKPCNTSKGARAYDYWKTSA